MDAVCFELIYFLGTLYKNAHFTYSQADEKFITLFGRTFSDADPWRHLLVCLFSKLATKPTKPIIVLSP
jgi:hypothetical protein